MDKELERRHKVIGFNEQIINELKDITTPLECLGADSFAYLRIMDNGNILRIGTNLNYNKYVIEKDVMNTYQFIPDKLLQNERLILPASPTETITDALKSSNITSVLGSVAYNEGYIEGWAVYSSRNDKDMTTCFISNLSLIERYIAFFNFSLGKDIIKTMQDEKIYIETELDLTRLRLKRKARPPKGLSF